MLTAVFAMPAFMVEAASTTVTGVPLGGTAFGAGCSTFHLVLTGVDQDDVVTSASVTIPGVGTVALTIIDGTGPTAHFSLTGVTLAQINQSGVTGSFTANTGANGVFHYNNFNRSGCLVSATSTPTNTATPTKTPVPPTNTPTPTKTPVPPTNTPTATPTNTPPPNKIFTKTVTSVNGSAPVGSPAQVTPGSTVVFTVFANGLLPSTGGYAFVEHVPAFAVFSGIDPLGTPTEPTLPVSGPNDVTLPNNTSDGAGTITRVLTFTISPSAPCGTTITNTITFVNVPDATASVQVVCP